MIWLLLLLLNGLFYLLLMIWYHRGLDLIQLEPQADNPPLSVSVVVAARNEAERLPALMEALRHQSVADFEYEVLLVNDGSEDATGALIAEAAAVDQRFRALATSPGQRGKKHALTRGIEQARYPLIAVCDADSVPGPAWLSTLAHSFAPTTGMVLGLTRLTAVGTLFSRIMRLEYAGILGIGLATAALGVPLFASGSNLAYRRRAFEEADGYRGVEHIRSGDDTFLIQRLHRNTDWLIRPCVAHAAMIRSRAPRNFRQLLAQRARWSSTQLRLPDPRLTLIGINSYLLVTGIPFLLAIGIWQPVCLAAALLLLGLKASAETGFLLRANRMQQLQVRWHEIVVGQFWELVYIPVSPWLGLTGLWRWRRR